MAERSFNSTSVIPHTSYSTSANSPNANQLACDDFQMNHRLNSMAAAQEGQDAAAPLSLPSGQVEALQAEVRELEKTRTLLSHELEEMGKAMNHAGAALIACFGILSFYADPETWKEDWFAGKRLGDSPAMSDRGARARTMMQNIKETR